MDRRTDENSVVIQITNYNTNYNESSRVKIKYKMNRPASVAWLNILLTTCILHQFHKSLLTDTNYVFKIAFVTFSQL